MYNLDIVLSPLDQFEIRDLVSINLGIINNYHISLTNIGLYLTISMLIILGINILTTNYNRLVSNT
jgi:F-type H+-transporting ATPase subunit a